MEVITSYANEYLKKIAALNQKKYRFRERLFIVEGRKNIEMALTGGYLPETVFFEDGAEHDETERLLMEKCSCRMIAVPVKLLKKLTDTVTPQRVAAVFHMRDMALDWNKATGTIVALNQVRDPGNMGAIIRSAAAAGACGIVTDSGCADIYAPKVIRASAGAVFHLPVIQTGDFKQWLAEAKAHGYKIIGTALDDDSVSYKKLPKLDKRLIVMGNEGSGMLPDVLAQCDYKVIIPLRNGVESLNVATAAAVMLFEFAG